MSEYMDLSTPSSGGEKDLRQRRLNGGDLIQTPTTTVLEIDDDKDDVRSRGGRRGGGGHGGVLRDDDDDDKSLLSPSSSSSSSSQAPLSNQQGHGQEQQQPSAFEANTNTNTNTTTKKVPSFYQATGQNLRDHDPHLPRIFLSYAFRNNSFFAKRLLRYAILLSVIMIIGLGLYYFYEPEPGATGDGFFIQHPDKVYAFNATACENMVGFSALVYHMVFFILIIALPASGFRFFEPFQRTPAFDIYGNKQKIKRTLFFQVCEMAGVLVLALNVFIFIYFWYMFLNGGAFRCNRLHVRLYALIAMFCYLGIFRVLNSFARFREHIKMQLGAFKEADQTGDIRKRVMDPGTTKLLSKRSQVVSNIRKQLYRATKIGDLKEIQEIIQMAKERLGQEFGMELYGNCHLHFFGMFALSKKNPFHVAAYHGNIPAMDILFTQSQLDINGLDKFSRVRFSTGDLFWYFAQFFISKPVDTQEENAVSIFKTTLVTPLHCAVATGHVQAVKWLIQHGAQVNIKALSSSRNERIPPIFLADHPEIVKILLFHGANPLFIPDPGHMNTITVLQLAYLKENYGVAQILEDFGSDVALTPLHFAAGMNHIEKVQRILKNKTNPNCLGEHGYIGMNRRTPLHWACVNGAKETCAILLNSQADPNFQDIKGRTPLHWAAKLNQVDIVQLLLEHNADPNLLDIDQMTPMICAAYGKKTKEKVFKLLVEYGANIHYQLPTNGDTALHIAIRLEHLHTCFAILKSGGNIMQTNLHGLRPIDCTTNTKLQFEIKKAAGKRDVMISYTHSHQEFAIKLRSSLEDANITTWLDLMDPSGIGGGSVWREEIARGITNAALVVCILTEDYAQSEWCLKELALAKQVGTPIVAISTENAIIGEELQVYLYTRQMIPFESAIVQINHPAKKNTRQITYEYDEDKYASQFRLLLDGVRDEIEKNRKATIQARPREGRGQSTVRNTTDLSNNTTTSSHLQMNGLNMNMMTWNTQMMNQDFIFLSHGDLHGNFVAKIYEELSEYGLSCYVDSNMITTTTTTTTTTTGITTNETAARIHAAKEAILKCTCFVVILSQRTCKNEIVRDQLAFAEDKGKPIFPIVLNDLDVGLDKKYTLARMELYHFIKDGLGFKSSMGNLLDGLKQYFNMSAYLTGGNHTTRGRHGNISTLSNQNSSFLLQYDTDSHHDSTVIMSRGGIQVGANGNRGNRLGHNGSFVVITSDVGSEEDHISSRNSMGLSTIEDEEGSMHVRI